MGSKHIPIEEVTPNGTMTKFLKNYVAGINFGSTLNSHISQHIRNYSKKFIFLESPMSLLSNALNGAYLKFLKKVMAVLPNSIWAVQVRVFAVASLWDNNNFSHKLIKNLSNHQ